MDIIAHLSDSAFQSLLISSIETFPSVYIPAPSANGQRAVASQHEGESFGLLFGQRMLKGDDIIFNVTLAVPMQTASRKEEMVHFSRRHFSRRHFSRIREVTESFPFLEFLGTFHSHPCHKDDYDAQTISGYSEEDALSAIGLAEDYGNELLEVILGITALARHSRRPALMEDETIQSYCGRFKYSLSAYCTLGAAMDEEEDDEEETELDLEILEEMYAMITADEWDQEDGEEDEEEDVEEDTDLETLMVPVDRLICPLAAHGGGIFGKTDIQG